MIILMGVLGAGKSVQGELLAKNTGYEWLSTGSYIRDNVTGDLREKMLQGELLEDKELFKILSNYFEKADSSRVILDGFPRTISQAEWLIDELAHGKIEINAIVFLDASEEVAKARLMKRGRADDSEEIIAKRIRDYQNLTLPVVEWFEKNGLKVMRVDAEQDVERVQENILEGLNIKKLEN